jgi:hypothetical protein
MPPCSVFAYRERRPSSTILLSRDAWGPAPMSILMLSHHAKRLYRKRKEGKDCLRVSTVPGP